MKKIFLYSILFSHSIIYADVIDITADHFYASDINHEAFFEGNAQITQGSNSFFAEKIKVFFNNKRKAKKYEASGGVSFDLIENGIHYKGHSFEVSYAPMSSNYFFTGDVVLEDLTNNRVIKAASIILDLKTGLADIKGTDTKPVHFRFEIEDRD